MRAIHLILTTPAGDELGRLPVPEAVVAGAGESGSLERPGLHQDMAELTAQIRQAVEREGMAIALPTIDLQIAVSRALLADGEGDVLPIALPVSPANDEGGTDRMEGPPSTELSLLDDLFPFDDLGWETGTAFGGPGGPTRD